MNVLFAYMPIHMRQPCLLKSTDSTLVDKHIVIDLI